jgi:ribosome-binding protein aMBF1 (putative translation factor)
MLSPIISPFADALRMARARVRMSQWTLSLKSGVQPYLISKFENGHMQPTVEQRTKLETALGVDLTRVE